MLTCTKIAISEDSLQRVCREFLGTRLLSHLELTDGYFNTAFRMELADGRIVVIKIAPPDTVRILRYEKDLLAAEVRAMKIAKRLTTIPVPEILVHVEDRQVLGAPFYVMPFLEGVPLKSTRERMSPDSLIRTDREVGGFLKQLNLIEGSRFGVLSQAAAVTWREAFQRLFEDLVSDGREIGVVLPYDEIRDRLAPHWALLDSVVSPRLVHWDLWEGNIFVRPESGEVLGIIDFERSLWGDPLIEFNFINPSAAFLEGYGPSPMTDHGAAVRRRIYTIYLTMIILIEAPYRQYSEDAGQIWARELFEKELSAL